jgi:arylamine N-acetyltransferase
MSELGQSPDTWGAATGSAGPDLDDDDVNAYLTRLGLEREPPSASALTRLHRAHAERIPYETLWIHTGDLWGLEITDSVRRIAHERRGGYCFHLNGAFWALLRALGYDAHRHVDGVHVTGEHRAADHGNHLVVTVHGLPSDRAPDGTWYVDVGLGDALHEPLPLRAGRFRQAPWQLTLEATPDRGDADWLLTHDPLGGFPTMSWRATTETSMAPFAAQHTALSTDPDSGFVRVFTAQLRDATGVTVVRGLLLKRIGDGASEEVLDTQTALADTLGDVFGLDLGTLSASTRAALWDRLRRQHDAWSSEATSTPPIEPSPAPDVQAGGSTAVR